MVEKNGNPVIAFRLPKPEHAALTFIAAQCGVTENDFIRKALWEALVQHFHEFAAAIGKHDGHGRLIQPLVDAADHPGRGCCSE